METQELKKKLIKKIEAADENQLRQLDNIIDSLENEDDWYDEASPDLKKALNKSLAQIERGELITHEQVMRETREKYGLK